MVEIECGENFYFYRTCRVGLDALQTSIRESERDVPSRREKIFLTKQKAHLFRFVLDALLRFELEMNFRIS